MRSNISSMAFVLAILCSNMQLVADEPSPGKQVEQQMTLQIEDQELTVHYLLFLPEDYDGEQQMPLMLFMHGSGERGEELELVKTWGPPKIVENRADFPFVVVSPQCPAEQRWNVDLMAHLVDALAGELAIDNERMYVTGLSMGGFGTWALLAKHPNLFAAAIPICGGGEPAAAERFKHVPIWVFHGDEDTSVPADRSREMVSALEDLGADVTYTEFEGVGHNSWSPAYRNEEIYKWLLSHRRKQAE